MITILVLLVYAFALGLPLWLLYHFKAQAWYWHVLSLAAALGLGFMPTPAGWQGPAYDLLFGGTFVLLTVWGIGGIAMYGTHVPHRKHA
ncbi:MAG TPA: hypothetical protein VN442_14795 [Bryobacteraceae bacterium]|nr:hypothetical protein [Bryobacteraceae bacterium]